MPVVRHCDTVSTWMANCSPIAFLLSNPGQDHMHLLHWSYWGALFPGNARPSMTRTLTVRPKQGVSVWMNLLQVATNSATKATLCHSQWGIVFLLILMCLLEAWCVFRNFLNHASFMHLSCIFHSSFSMCSTHFPLCWLPPHLKLAKDFASRTLRLSKTAGSTPWHITALLWTTLLNHWHSTVVPL